MTATSINNLVSATLNAAHAYGKGVAALRDAAKAQLKGTMSRDTVRDMLLAPVAAYYGVTLQDKARGEGKTMDKDAKGYEAAKKALQRLTSDVMGKTAEASDQLEVPEAMMVLARKLVAEGAKYEQAAKLIATAIAAAKAE